jgi:hypothetical protein
MERIPGVVSATATAAVLLRIDALEADPERTGGPEANPECFAP